ncbi:sphingomyelin phosphodiesterase 4-like [Physella acuta]|uniref:sphingomyelin phosphodiesterase 4-like n=1 Tax=Physella acuta TaxID=109671 RepID=UPI0027DADBAF|nr:sphingomyelin phosphodiesterase 4-like [Physella acuta]
MAAYNTVIEHINAAQSKPLLHKVQLVDEILRGTSIKELKSSFSFIVHEIFDFERDQNQGWQLDKIHRHYQSELFDCVRALLAPEGPMMKVVNSLHNDSSALYEFPLKYIPAPARQMIESGAIPSFYANKLQTQNFRPAVLVLNAFEFYIFHLAFALVSPVWRARNQSWSDLYEYIYPTIIDSLLIYFFPCDKNSLPSIPHSSSTGRPPIITQTQGRPYSYSTGQAPYLNAGNNNRSLFKTSFINAQKQHMQSMPVYDQAETEIWRSETLLQVLTEFWLNQNSLNSNETHAYSSGFQVPDMFYRDPFQSILEHFLPTMNHVKMVRLLVKYLHYFANSATSIITSPYQQTVHSPLDQFKRSVIPHILQKKLYTFLRHGFNRWPLDSCFRMVLETWLSYIQPWRYKNFAKGVIIAVQHPESSEQVKFVENRWERFVEENLLFYTALLSDFIPRVFRMDLSSPYSAYMVYRVSRILSLPNLTKLIYKAELELFGNIPHHNDLGNSYITNSMLMSHTLPSQMLDLEGPNFQYQSFFSEDMKYSMSRVVKQLFESLDMIRTQLMTSTSSKNSKKKKGILAKVLGLCGTKSIYSTPEYERLPGHLEQSIINFCTVFDLTNPLCDSEPPVDSHLSTSIANESMYLADAEVRYPDCIETEMGIRLTDLGRRQLINKERKFESFYVGDPELQPVRSYENTALVRLLFHFCSFINLYFRKEFENAYKDESFKGYLARVFLIPPSYPEDQLRRVRSPISDRTAQLIRSHQPRISLRFLASYHTMIYICLAYLCSMFVLGTGPLSFFFLVLVIVILGGLLKAVKAYLFHKKIE